MSVLQMDSLISKGLGREFANPKQNTVANQADVASILDCMTKCLRKRLVKEQTTICTDSQQVAGAALGVRGTKSLLAVDCIKKLTALSEVNQVTIIGVPGHGSIQ